MHTAHYFWLTQLLALIQREYRENRLLFLWLPVGLLVLVQIVLSVELVRVGNLEPEIITLPSGASFNANNHVLTDLNYSIYPELVSRWMGDFYVPPLTLLGVAFWSMLLGYFLLTLYRQRQNRSILFWSSMPVSNTQCLFSKLLAGYVVAGGIYVAAILVTQVQVLVSILVFGWITDNPLSYYFDNAHVVSRSVEFTVAGLLGLLWCLPVHGALLLASSWAKRAPFAWVVAGPVVYTIIELAVKGNTSENIENSLMIRIVSHTWPQWSFESNRDGLAATISEIWSLELLLSVLLGSLFIALAIRFNRVDE